MKLVSLLMLWAVATLLTAAAPVTLVRDGKTLTAIYAAPDIMDQTELPRTAPAAEKEREARRIRVRESVRDLARCLGIMTGAEVPIYTRRPEAGEKTLPILIGHYADTIFGPFTIQTEYKQNYRLVVSPKGIGMQGETEEGISYAVYEMLDRLGCRWYLPGEMGEVIPSKKTVALDAMDVKSAPGTFSRAVIWADNGFKRRNRLGGFNYSAKHALEGYLTKEQLEQHPLWQAEIGGKRILRSCDVGYRICWGNPEVSDAVADSIIARLDKAYVSCVSVSPGDGLDFCECAQCKALDTGDWDNTTACISITDRYVHFVNRIAERVTKKYPGVKLGFLAYVQYTRPPKREKLHPALIPQLAPITYCRAHALDDPTCPSRQQVKSLLEGWSKVSKNIAMYEYNFHLAEVAAPFPAIKRNVVELPVQYANNVTMWTPETMANFESFLPGIYLGIRMSWYTDANPQAILDEFYTNFYGSAAGAMCDYWQYIDDLWTTVPEHAGCGFSYLRRFTPQAMTTAREKMDAALAACKTIMEYRRVKLADDSLRQHELFMKIRQDYFAGKTSTLSDDANRWLFVHKALAEEYKENYTFTMMPWAPNTVSAKYFSAFYNKSYQDMARIGKECAIVTPPLLSWRFAVDTEKHGETQGWQQPSFVDTAWKITNVALDTWYALGLESYYGPAWYRTSVKLPTLPAGKKTYLWVGATDGACKVFVNGTHVPFVNAKGEQSDEANGYCMPFSFDITAVAKGNAHNQITIIGDRRDLNELGTGGLLGPVLIYREK